MDPSYLPGFGDDFETEALPGALPQGQNSPQRCAYGLYAEQLSGSPFTAPRGTNERSWLYRIRPSVRHTGRFAHASVPHGKSASNVDDSELPIGQLRWDPAPMPNEPTDFIRGVRTMTTAGDVHGQVGMAAHVYAFNAAMKDDYFFNADGELLVVPQEGEIAIFTELGKMAVAPGEIAVVPRGMMIKVAPGDGPVRGYLCENYGAKFTLPDRGPIGANCLANPRDFKTPVAAFEDKEAPCRVHVKWGGRFYVTEIDHSPLDVVAWHGPDASGFEKASTVALKPVKLDDTMAFMFETRFPHALTRYAAEAETRQDDYQDCWAGSKKRFDGTTEGKWD